MIPDKLFPRQKLGNIVQEGKSLRAILIAATSDEVMPGTPVKI